MNGFSPERAKVALRLEIKHARESNRESNLLLSNDFAKNLKNWIAQTAGELPGIVVASYLPFGSEPDVAEFNRTWIAEGNRLLLPVSNADHSLTWIDWDGHSQALGMFNFAEPVGQVADIRAAHAMILPAMAADMRGRRLGKGKGFYDRELASLAIPTAAVVFDSEVFDEIPHESHDRKVGAVITQSKIIKI